MHQPTDTKSLLKSFLVLYRLHFSSLTLLEAIIVLYVVMCSGGLKSQLAGGSRKLFSLSLSLSRVGFEHVANAINIHCPTPSASLPSASMT